MKTNRPQGWIGRSGRGITSAIAVTLLAGFCMSSDARALGKKRPPSRPTPIKLPSDPVPAHGSYELRLLSYNVYGLPFPWVDQSRYKDIGRILARRRADGTAPHVVMLQETFASQTNELNATARYPYIARGPQAQGIQMSAGLTILSEFPLTGTATTIYPDCAGTDCMARKGVVVARAHIPGVPSPIEIYNTHLNAGYDGGTVPDHAFAERIRLRQVERIRTFMRAQRDSRVPAIFGGDFNFMARGLDYAAFESMSGMENSGRTCAERYYCSGAPEKYNRWMDYIDHVFYIGGSGSGDAAPPMEIRPIHYEHTFIHKTGGRMLSDHPGVETTLELSW